MKSKRLFILIFVAASFGLLFWAGGHPEAAWRIEILKMKLSGRLEGLEWSDLIAGMNESEPLRFGSTTAFAGLRGINSGLVSLERFEDSGPCPALWSTPAGSIWGRFSDEGSLEALFVEQLLLQIYQNDLVSVAKGDVVMDVGAHLGTFTKLALQNEARLVVAFEPEPTNIECFKRTFEKELEEEKVILMEAAVWNESGTISFSSFHHSGATAQISSDGEIQVAAVTLDESVEELGLEQVDFIKMDIEGAERKALAGATRLMAEFAPQMALSTYHLPDDPQVIVRLALAARPTYQVVSVIGFAYFSEQLDFAHSGPPMRRALLELDRNGRVEVIREIEAPYSFPRFSPDGKQLALAAGESSRYLWIVSLEDGKETRLVSDAGLNWAPVWSPDGTQLAFSARDRDGYLNIYRVTLAGDKVTQRLTTSQRPQIVESWSEDGKTLAFSQLDIQNGSDIWTIPLEEDGPAEPAPFLATPHHEGWARFSPDGHWIAYASNENGYLAVFVRPFPGPGEKIQISKREGWYPRWGPQGEELFYRVGSRVVAVTIRADEAVLLVGEPRELFEGDYSLGFHLEGGAWDVSPVGERIVMLRDRLDGRFRWTATEK